MSVILFCKIQFSDILLCLHIAILQNLSFFLYVRFNMFVSNALTNTLQLPLLLKTCFDLVILAYLREGKNCLS